MYLTRNPFYYHIFNTANNSAHKPFLSEAFKKWWGKILTLANVGDITPFSTANCIYGNTKIF